MSEQPDYTQVGEIYRKTMEEALANIDKVNEDLKKEHEKVIELQFDAKEDIKRIEREAHQISEAYIDKHRNEYLEQIRNEVLEVVVRKLILNEVPSDKLKTWLELSPKFLSDAWFFIGFEKLDDLHVAHVAYDSHGRSGDVIFYRNDLTLHFPFEYGGGETLASVEIPTMENWEKETGLSQGDRNTILEFVAKRVIRDQASQCTYVIHPDRIQIKY
jgi:hypothetical protein